MISNETYDKIRSAWSRETSSDPENWSPLNPSWGQCAVTAALVQDLGGGDIVWSLAELSDGRKISHYFNVIPVDMTGEFYYDFTRHQFPPGTKIGKGIPKLRGTSGEYYTTRDYILSYPKTRERYELLKKRFEEGK